MDQSINWSASNAHYECDCASQCLISILYAHCDIVNADKVHHTILRVGLGLHLLSNVGAPLAFV